MANLHQVRVALTGMKGAPGVMTFHFDAGNAVPMPYLASLVQAIAAKTPPSVVFKFPTSGIDIDPASGAAVGSWTASATTDVTGSAAGNYAAPVGGVINWNSGIYAGGRQVRGKTFMVPLASSCFQSDGTMDDAIRNALEVAAGTFRTGAPDFRIWSRRLGGSFSVASARVPDMAVVLRSRRD